MHGDLAQTQLLPAKKLNKWSAIVKRSKIDQDIIIFYKLKILS